MVGCQLAASPWNSPLLSVILCHKGHDYFTSHIGYCLLCGATLFVCLFFLGGKKWRNPCLASLE
jgi:hypothetical protein